MVEARGQLELLVRLYYVRTQGQNEEYLLSGTLEY